VRWPRKLLRLSNRKLTRTGLLEYHYDKLYGHASLFDLPECPQLHMLATNLSEGCLCSFNRDGLLVMRRRRPSDSIRVDQTRASLATVSMAVTASSAFPAFFPPLELNDVDVGAGGDFGRQAFTDGGIFDNLGIRMFHYLDEYLPGNDFTVDGVLISDVGKRISTQSQEQHAGGAIRTGIRASDILMDRVWQLETEKFKDTPGFAFARIVDVVERHEDATALHPEIQRQLPRIRTDFDRFSQIEISSLVQHGYCVGRKVCRTRPDLFGSELPDNPPWDPFPEVHGPASVLANAQGSPAQYHVATTTATEARQLQNSAIRRIWTTLLDYRDWTSYTYVPILVPILILLPFLTVKFYQRSHRINQIVESLSQGSRDLEQMSRLLDSPIVPWKGVAPEEVRSFDEPDLTGFEILQDMRILDLRNWNPTAEGSSDAESLVYGYRRLKVFKKPDQAGSAPFRMLLISTSPLTQVRFPPQQVRGKVRMAKLESSNAGQGACRWEASFDFGKVPAEEYVDLIVEYFSPGQFLQGDRTSTTLSFEIQGDTAEVTRWLLLPRGREYQSFRVVRYKTGQPETVEDVRIVTEYLADDFTILAYKLLAVPAGYTYEVSWMYK
jgi:hypothetical protein